MEVDLETWKLTANLSFRTPPDAFPEDGGRSLLEEVRNAVFTLRVPLNEFIVEAFAEKLERMKQEHNGGKPFPQRLPGRRVS